MASPPQVVSNHPNATAVGASGAFVTVASVIASDAFGYTPSTAAFWPAVATVVSVVVLTVGPWVRNRTKK